MRFIEHIIEPERLLLAWQSSDERHRRRYVVAELNKLENRIDLSYLVNTKDFEDAKKNGFEGYPAFQDLHKTHQNVLDAFLRRLPPRARGDFPQYLERLRLSQDLKLSDFALLGYSGARLLSDGFSVIHPFDNVNGSFELLIDAAGFRHIQNNHDGIKINDSVSFVKEYNEVIQEEAVRIITSDKHIGYVTRPILSTFLELMNDDRILGAWIEKINGTPGKPSVYIYVQVGPIKEK